MTTKSKRPKNKAGLQGRVQSVEVGARLLKMMAKVDGPQMLKDISRAAQMSPAKVHRYLASLIREGIIEQNEVDSRYDFGGAAREIGQAALARLDIVRIGTTTLLDLSNRLHETVLLGVWGNGGATVIYSLTAPKPVSIHVRVGSVLPTLTSAIGKTCAAYLPRALTAKSIEHERAANKKAGLSPQFHQQKMVEAMLEQVRQRGFSVVTGELMAGIHAVGVPVFGKNNDLIAVISSAGAAGSLDIRGEGIVVKELKQASKRFSVMVGQ